MIIKIEEEIQDQLIKFAESQQIEYEKSKGVKCSYTPFYFTASEENNKICGVVSGYTCYAEVYIDDIIVFSEYRNQGIGKKLIQAIEQHFSNGLYNNINLVTNAFQAPEFYKKCGFTLEFTRYNNQNPLLNKYFFVKFFDNSHIKLIKN